MFKPVIGLEIHVELKTRSKMFCGCKNDSQEKEPNLNICPVCTGHPGTLPVINKKALEFVIKTGLALNCKIATRSHFERKNYFYPDLPKGYQISQYKEPLCFEGYLKIKDKKIRIRRIHLEEDTARLLHLEREKCSLIDFNRAGVPLMEIVTEPDIESSKEASDFAKELQLILRYLEVSWADMEKGQLRVEANVSLSQSSNIKSQNLGTKAEIKNLNSFRAVEGAIEYEIKRQDAMLGRGEKIIQQTMGWNSKKQETFVQREKEEAHDYRYFPEPDIPPLEIEKECVEEIRKTIPELPQDKRKRLKKEFTINDQAVEILISNRDLSEYFEKLISELLKWAKDKKIKSKEEKNLIRGAANYLLTDALGFLEGKDFVEKDFPITPENFGEFISIIYQQKFTSKMAKIIIQEMFFSKKDPSQIIREKNISPIRDLDQIKTIAQKIISTNPRALEDYKGGKENALQFMIGQMMKETKGNINPEIARKALIDALK